MCMPVGHIMAATTWFVALRYQNKIWNRHTLFSWSFFVFFSNLPDIDFIPYAITGKPKYYFWHHGWTHSLGAAILCSFIYYTFCKKLKKYCSVFEVLILYLTHLILDFFTLDLVPPIGIPLFWPLWKKYFTSSIPLFCFFLKSGKTSIARYYLLSKLAIYSYLWEFFFFLLIIFVLIFFKSSRTSGYS